MDIQKLGDEIIEELDSCLIDAMCSHSPELRYAGENKPLKYRLDSGELLSQDEWHHIFDAGYSAAWSIVENILEKHGWRD